ncbi:MAG: 2-amino-4-hydroxy-6-hydroxymethyldihydropteridine diphosphokinase [Planctomycetes bacterium]|nr:2-amino-4-hydroxy-6-hydroxymethyldihydropteridine diphosphokinase [Planctomycetota bacterium]
MARCLLGLGSNLGNRRAMLRRATGSVKSLSGCQLLAQSRWHETTPIGGPAGQGAFLNGALLLDCTIPAEDLAKELQTIESQLGRNRAIRWDARAIDIDLLLFADQVIESPNLLVPHPRMSFRKFVLEPAAEIAGFMVDPVSGWTLARLLCHLQEAPRYVAVASADIAIAAWLAEELCQKLGCLRLEPLPEAGLARSAATCRAQKKPGAPKETAAVESACGKSQQGVPPVVNAFGYDEVVAGKLFQTEQIYVPTQWGTPSEKGPPADASILHPALLITVEPSSQENFWKKMGTKKRKKNGSFLPQSSFQESLKGKGHGPMARIQADEPTVVLQEAIAAIRSVWPELPVLSTE